jgi:hypothetical protein
MVERSVGGNEFTAGGGTEHASSPGTSSGIMHHAWSHDFSSSSFFFPSSFLASNNLLEAGKRDRKLWSTKFYCNVAYCSRQHCLLRCRKLHVQLRLGTGS